MLPNSRTLPIWIFALATSPLFAAANSITLAWENAPRSIDPRFNSDADSIYLEDLIHCSLVTFDREGKTVGDLAETMTWKSPTTFEIKIKKTAKFGNGTSVTPGDVKATYDYFLKRDLKTPSPRASAFSKITTIAVDDKSPLNVTFTLSEPDASFATNLVVGILPASLASLDQITDINAQPTFTGCGPYLLKAMDASGLLLEKNPHYGLGASPKTPMVEVKIVKDEQTRYAKLEKGEVDIIQNSVSRDKLEEIAKKPGGLKILRRQGINTTYLGFNMQDPALANVKVRQAIGLAINPANIIKYILKDYAKPAAGLLTPTDTYADSSLKPGSYDPKAAASLLESAGFFSGGKSTQKNRLALSYKTTTNATRISIAKAIAADLKKVGIDVTVESLEWGKFKDDVEKGRVQLWSLAWIGFKDPDIYRFAFATESFPPNGANRGRYSNPTLDKLVAEGRVTPDVKARKKIYDQVQRLIAAELPYIFLWHEDTYAVVGKSIEGFELYADGRYSSLKNTIKK